MPLLTVHNLSKSFGAFDLFSDLTFSIPHRARLGLVGPNGIGKTTLLKIILGEEEASSGKISKARGIQIGYLPQEAVLVSDRTLWTECMTVFAPLIDKQHELTRLEGLMAHDPANIELIETYGHLQAEFDALGGYTYELQTRMTLTGLGFTREDESRPLSQLSGGQRTRALLAKLLLSNPDLLLLDEPTNHLDTESLEWLESYLKDYPGTILTIAHDRVFLDKIVNQIAELSNHRLTVFKGNYSYYLAEKERRLEALKKQMALQRSEIKKTQEFVERFRFKATKAKQVQSRLKMLERFEVVELEKGEKRVHIRFPEAPKSGREVVAARHISKSYGDVSVFTELDLTIHRGEKIALVGVNGAGKSTLSRILSGTEAPSSGQVQYGLNVSLAFFSQESAQNLDYGRTVWDEVRLAGTRSNDQERRNLLGAFLFSGDDVYKEIAVLSGGEKSRLALLKILLQDSNLLILDEPTNHLDLKTKDIFQNALLSYTGTLVLVSHDRFFLDRLVHRVIEIRDGRRHEYLGNYSYFIQKRNEMAQADAGGANTLPAESGPLSGTGDLPSNKKLFKTKEEKRLEAQERNRLSRITRELKNELTALEDRIARLETRKAENETTLCAPDIHREPHKIKLLNQEMADLAREIEPLYAAWDRMTAEMETVLQTTKGPP